MTVAELAQAAKRDRAYMLPLWEAVVRLIALWARRYMQGTPARLYDVEDLTQAGYLALADAVAGYEPQAGADFTTYLRYHVRKRFAEVARRKGTKRAPYVLSLDEPLDDEADTLRVDTVADPDADTAEAGIADVWNKELRRALDECIATLPEEHAAVIRARYYEGAPIPGSHSIEQSALYRLRRGKNGQRLWVYIELCERQYRRGGYRRFRETGYSSVEEAVERLLE
jgi:RNA polymerase sigma factor (sigma-70 family)